MNAHPKHAKRFAAPAALSEQNGAIVVGEIRDLGGRNLNK